MPADLLLRKLDDPAVDLHDQDPSDAPVEAFLRDPSALHGAFQILVDRFSVGGHADHVAA